MQALEFTAELAARVVSVAEPEAAPGEVVVGITSAGVCGSDVTALRGKHPFRVPPLITGHEGGGRVVALGEGVDEDWLGRRVALEPQRACGECPPCVDGLVHLCRHRLMLGMAGWTGTLAEYVTAPLSCLHPVADDVPDGLLALAEPLAVATHALGRAPALAGRSVGVLGGGPIGALLVHLAVAAGASDVLVTDPREHARSAGAALGAATTADPTSDAGAGTVREHTDRLDAVFVAVGAPGVLDQAVTLCRPRGTVVEVALLSEPVEMDVAALQQGEKTLVGSNVYTAADVDAAVTALERSWPDLAALVTDARGLDGVVDHLTGAIEGRPNDVIKLLARPGGGAIEMGDARA